MIIQCLAHGNCLINLFFSPPQLELVVDRKPHDIFGTSILLKDYFKANIYILNRQKYLEENATFVRAINVKCELPKTFSTWGDGSRLQP